MPNDESKGKESGKKKIIRNKQQWDYIIRKWEGDQLVGHIKSFDLKRRL